MLFKTSYRLWTISLYTFIFIYFFTHTHTHHNSLTLANLNIKWSYISAWNLFYRKDHGFMVKLSHTNSLEHNHKNFNLCLKFFQDFINGVACENLNKS